MREREREGGRKRERGERETARKSEREVVDVFGKAYAHTNSLSSVWVYSASI